MKPLFFAGLFGISLLVVGAAGLVTLYKVGLEPAIRQFMDAGVAKEVDRAYACWSPEAITRETIASVIEEHYDHLFRGYRGISTSSWSMAPSKKKGWGEPQPVEVTEGRVSGTILSTNDDRLQFEAWLTKKDGVWKLSGFHIAEEGLSITLGKAEDER